MTKMILTGTIAIVSIIYFLYLFGFRKKQFLQIDKQVSRRTNNTYLVLILQGMSFIKSKLKLLLEYAKELLVL